MTSFLESDYFQSTEVTDIGVIVGTGNGKLPNGQVKAGKPKGQDGALRTACRASGHQLGVWDLPSLSYYMAGILLQPQGKHKLPPEAHLQQASSSGLPE